jgi:uncharacterized membrane protein
VIPALVLLGVTPYRRDPFVRFHAMQCVVLTALAIAGRVMLHYSHFKPMLVSGFYTLGMMAVWVLALVMAAQGTALWIPVVSHIAQSLAE